MGVGGELLFSLPLLLFGVNEDELLFIVLLLLRFIMDASLDSSSIPLMSLFLSPLSSVVCRCCCIERARAASNDDNNNSNDDEFFNCKSFHKLMWNDTSTTHNDKERWIYECISTPYFVDDVDDSSSQSTQSAQQLNKSYDDDKFASTSSSSMMMTPLEVFTSSYSCQSKQHSKHSRPIWRLTQKHGGPCGILASIQAELIRILLFGRGGPTSQKELYYPFTPSSLSNYNANNCVAAPINKGEVKEALGMSIGMILARAALAPTLNSNNNNGSSSAIGDGGDDVRGDCVRLVLPTRDYYEDCCSQQQQQQQRPAGGEEKIGDTFVVSMVPC